MPISGFSWTFADWTPIVVGPAQAKGEQQMHQDRLKTPCSSTTILPTVSPGFLPIFSSSRTSIRPISEPCWGVLWMLDFYNPGPDEDSWDD